MSQPAGREESLFQGLASVGAELLPAADRPTSELQATLERLAPPLHAEAAAVWSPDGHLLAAVGEPLPPPDRRHPFRSWSHPPRALGVTMRLPDGRWLSVRHPRLIHP